MLFCPQGETCSPRHARSNSFDRLWTSLGLQFVFVRFICIYLYLYTDTWVVLFINRSICWSCLSLVYKGDEGCLLWDRRGPCFRDVFTDEGKRAWELGSDLILSLWWKISIEGKRNKVLYVEYLYTYMFNLEGLIFKEVETNTKNDSWSLLS